ncbi:MAG: Uma2 family endonuclease [Planctomycetes bacterium]|nr:Uma2 family endonuclease [Planctomycetota bacterium]
MDTLRKSCQYAEDMVAPFDLTQIIEGEEIVTPSPYGKHQEVVFNLAFHVRKYTQENDLGKVFISPLDVILEENVNRLQPDVIFIKNENMGICRDWIRGVPDMVVEVVSRGTLVMDTITKKNIYEKYKIPECWIVMPEFESVEVFVLRDNTYELFSGAEGKGTVASRIIEGFEIDMNMIFT